MSNRTQTVENRPAYVSISDGNGWEAKTWDRISPFTKLCCCVRALIEDQRKLTPEERLAAFRADVATMANPVFTLRAVDYLSQMQAAREFGAWYYATHHDALDLLHVDFVLEMPGSGFATLQITSSHHRGQYHRNLIKRDFAGVCADPTRLIPVVQLVGEDKQPIDDVESKRRLRESAAISWATWRGLGFSI
jgi:hypothetical protein